MSSGAPQPRGQSWGVICPCAPAESGSYGLRTLLPLSPFGVIITRRSTTDNTSIWTTSSLCLVRCSYRPNEIYFSFVERDIRGMKTSNIYHPEIDDANEKAKEHQKTKRKVGRDAET